MSSASEGRMLAAGFDIKPTQSAICAVMLYDAKLSQDFRGTAAGRGHLRDGFLLPGRPEGIRRGIRVQVSAGHTELDSWTAASTLS